VTYQHNTFRVRSLTLDGFVDQALEEGNIIHLSVKKVAACMGGIPESHPYDIHRAIWCE
jgi:hypothetical protein